MPEIISRKEAKARGLRFYFTGDPCVNGHVSERRVSNHACNICKGERARRHYLKHQTKILIASAKYRENNPEKVRDRKQRWEQKNKEKVRLKRRQLLRKRAHALAALTELNIDF